jgi:hypothetical protein
MLQIIFLFFGILTMIYLIIITKPFYENKKNPISKYIPNINIYPTDFQLINPNKKRILYKNNKKRKQKRKT